MSAAAETSQALPRPRRERWQPLRSGLLNLYRYDHEELWYEHGHMLLRGNNGTGKSRVLALQLPFLFDGEVSPHRLEPDGDPAKRVDWNLLMGKYRDRLGYTWLELGRLTGEDDEEGPGHERYLTLGCGLSAVAGRGLVGRWFFLTEMRVGEDFFLEGPAGEALARPRLAEVLGQRGEIFTTAGEYRAAVDRALFRLGRQRYEALVNLLIQLRQPQLSRKLDEAKLSSALSEALPPPDAQILADVADSFRSLEEDRQTLADLRAASRGVDAFLVGYRRYARIAARRRAEGVRSAHSAYEHTQRRLRSAETRRDGAAQQLAAVETELEGLAVEAEAAATEARTLEARPEMRDKQTLDAARQRAGERRRESERLAEELRRATAAREQREQQARQAEEAAAGTAAAAAERLAAAAEDAAAAGLAQEHRRQVDPLGLPEATDPAAAAAAAERLESTADQRRRGVRHVRQLQLEVERAQQALAAAKQRHTERAAELDQATEGQRRAHAAVEKSAAALLEAYGAWRQGLVELAPPTAGELAEQVEEWSRRPEGESPVAAAARAAEAAAAAPLATQLAAAAAQRDTVEAELERLRAERDELRAGVHRPPPTPHTRGEGAREARPGAPLWRLCDFADGVDATRRAGVEAALEAAGLLDAWVTPDGRVLDSDNHDAVLVAGSSQEAPAGRGLDSLLRPDAEAGAEVAPEVVRSVLRHIGLGAGAGEVWVDPDGRFQAGPLHGAWAKPAAQHLGAAAREAERRRRLDALAAEIAEVEECRAALAAELERLGERQRAARREAAAVPDDSAVRRAAADLDAAAGLVEQARERLVEAERRVAERRRALEEATTTRDEAARDLGILERLDDLEELEDAAFAYRRSLAVLWPAVAAHSTAAAAAAQAAARRLESAEEEERRRQVLAQGEQRRRAAEVERDTLERTVGAGVRELLEKLEEARSRAAQIRERERATGRRREHQLVERAKAEQVIEDAQATLERDTGERARAITALGRFAAAELVSVAVPELEAETIADPDAWSVSRAVEIARRLEADLGEVQADDAAWERQQRDVHRQFQTLNEVLLPLGYPPTLTGAELVVVTAPFQGRQQAMDSFRHTLGEEVGARDRVLAEREREVIENHLIGEVALHLHQRLRAAEELVAGMNGQIESRPMSTGMTLRFRWQALLDDFPGLGTARRLLIAEHGVWSPAERRAVGDFLHGLIQKEQAVGDAGTWQEHLARALDYRAWHHFSVERRQDDQWRRLTRRTHGTGSGGEKAIALTVPQFAAAAAHYDTADPRSPRLILLDEAFVGVDADMRSKCMGLLQAFDLDFVMTSEREWGCYPTLPGLAIYQLATRPGIDAVGITRWRWNGHERHQVEPPRPRPVPPRPEPIDGEPGLLFEGEG